MPVTVNTCTCGCKKWWDDNKVVWQFCQNHMFACMKMMEGIIVKSINTNKVYCEYATVEDYEKVHNV